MDLNRKSPDLNIETLQIPDETDILNIALNSPTNESPGPIDTNIVIGDDILNILNQNSEE